MRILVRTRTRSPVWVLFARKNQAIAARRARTREASGRELDHSKCARRNLNTPGLQCRSLTNDRPASIDEGEVDRELHEKRVNAVAGGEDQRCIARELGPTEKALVACRGIKGSLDEGSNDAVVTGIAQDPASPGIRQQAVEK